MDRIPQPRFLRSWTYDSSSASASGPGNHIRSESIGETRVDEDVHMIDSHLEPRGMHGTATNSSRTAHAILLGLDTKVDDINDKLQFLAKVVSSFERNASDISGQNHEHREFDGTKCMRGEESQRLAQERAELSSKTEILQGRLDAKQKALLEKEGEIRRLEEVNHKLRDIVLEKIGDQELSDNEIVQAFLQVRQGTLSLATSTALYFDQTPSLENDASPHLKGLYGHGAWESWKRIDRELHVHKELFGMLHRSILDTACFGIEGFEAASPEELGTIAQGLSTLEAMAKKQAVSTSVLANWRLATLECVEALNAQEHRSEYVANELCNFLAPILNKKLPQQAEKLRAQASKLCKDAFRLTIMMRKSREDYRCDAIKDMVQRPITDVESWCEPQAVDGGTASEKGDNVAYVLFGALCKNPIYRGESERVLVKAEVVLEKKSL